MKLACITLLLVFCLGNAKAQSQDELVEKESKRFTKRFRSSEGLTAASNNFQVHFYDCWWRINPAVREIDGVVDAHMFITIAATAVTFDLHSQLVVDSVKTGATKLTFQRGTNHTLTINLAAPRAAGSRDSVAIYYHGVPPGGGFGSFIKDEHAGVPVIWTLSEPYGARDWWPCRNGLDDKADSININITCTVPYIASSNGKLVSETPGNAITTYHFKHRYPIASYLVAFAVTNYTVLTGTVDVNGVNMPFLNYVYPEQVTSWQTTAPQVLQSMQQCNNWFGPYPFYSEKYAQTQFSWGGGMEHQTNSFITSTDRYLMAHELVHQWFGDKVTCGSWEDLWLNEGFATYFGDLCFRDVDPAYYRSLLQTQLNNVVSQPGGTVRVDDTTNINRLFSGRLTYDKAGYLLRMLNLTMGDSMFLKAVYNYVNDPALAFGFARTHHLKQHLEQVYGQSLDYFFNQWYTGQGYPSFNISWSQNEQHRARLVVKQTTSHSSIPFFKMPVPLTFKSGGQTVKKVIFVDSNDDEVFVDVGFAADQLVVNEDLLIISKNNVTVKTNDPVPPPPPGGEFSIKVFPTPVVNALTIQVDNPVSTTLDVKLVNTLGQVVLKRSYATNSSTTISLPLGFLARGVYHLMLRDEKGNLLLKRKVMK